MHSPPRAWTWYGVYCLLKVAFYTAVTVIGILLTKGKAEFFIRPLAEYLETDSIGPLLGQMMIWSGAPLIVLYVALLCLPRKPWAYWTHLSAILTGILMCLFAPLCIPLAIEFLRPPTREWFGLSGTHMPKPRPKFDV